MKARAKAALTALLTATALVAGLASPACGPFLNYAIFSYDNHPDFPLSKFAAGQLGVLSPSFARSYLAVAYRYLSGAPLSKQEQEGALALWALRLGAAGDSSSSTVDAWLKERAQVAGVKKLAGIDVDRMIPGTDSYQWFRNCLDAGFRQAAATLAAKITTYGAASPQVRRWVEAQDLVFCHCSDPPWEPGSYTKRKPEPPFPAPPGQDDDQALKADRQYQIAAAHFYATRYDDALEEFDAIARDQSSPWRQIAPYLAARALVRKATLAPSLDLAVLEKAYARVAKILQDPGLAPIQAEARELASYIRLRLQPDQYLVETSSALRSKDSGRKIAGLLGDFTTLIDNLLKQDPVEGPLSFSFEQVPDSARKDDLSDWVLTMQATGDPAFAHAYERWKETGSKAWLIAALVKAGSGDRRTADAMAAASAFKPGDPGYLTARYCSLRWLRQRGRVDEARRLADGVLAAEAGPSAANLFARERLGMARTFKEFVRFSFSPFAAVTYNDDGLELPADRKNLIKASSYAINRPGFFAEAAYTYNHMTPLAHLVGMLEDQSLPAIVRRDASQAVWTRAIMLGDRQAAARAAAVLRKQVPALAPMLDSYERAGSGTEKKFIASLIILRNPGMRPYVAEGLGRETPLSRIDDFQDNWWCAGESNSYAQNFGAAEASKLKPPSFFTPAEARDAARENAKLKALGPGPNYLVSQVMAWAKASGRDGRLPEALHLAVKATRFGCKDKGTTELSKQAFQFLHKNFPGNAWTAKTRYWF